MDMWKVTPARDMAGEDDEDTKALRAYLVEAKAFLLTHAWCVGIRNEYFGIGVGGVFAVFLFEIVPVGEDVDGLVWVVVGDVPSAYLSVRHCGDPASALAGYVAEMRAWVDAAKAGRSLKAMMVEDRRCVVRQSREAR
jgi:hypothetical protein